MKFALPILAVMVFLTSCETLIYNRDKLTVPPNTIILTFDDGPNEHGNVTAKLLDVLKSYHIQAFFSLIGFRVSNQPALAKRIYDEGHIIANHTYHHDPTIIGSIETVESEIDLNDAAIAQAIGVSGFKTKFFRTPMSILTENIKTVVSNRGLQYLPFSTFKNDSESGPSGARTVIDNIKSELLSNGGGILCLHDGVPRFTDLGSWEYTDVNNPADRDWVPGAVNEIILYFLSLGYRFNLTPAEMTNALDYGFIINN